MTSTIEAQNLFIPPEWQEKFEYKELIEETKEWKLILHEKRNLIPKELKGKEAVLNGFMNPVEIIDFPFRGKLMYIKFFRRKWKEKGETKGYFNQYELHPPGMKATKEFGAFLKELDREERHEFFCAWEDIRYLREEDF